MMLTGDHLKSDIRVGREDVPKRRVEGKQNNSAQRLDEALVPGISIGGR